MVKRMAVGLLVMVLVVLAVGTGLVIASRMRPPSAEQQAALELLKPRALKGSNAYPALLLMPYEVPDDEVGALAQAQSERFNRTPAGTPGVQIEVPYARRASASGVPDNCSWSEGRCLEKVRGSRDAFARRMASKQELLQRIRNLSRHGHYRSLMDARPDATFPEFQVLNAATTSHALQFVDGNVEYALAGVCGDVRTWRTLAPNADSLVASMIGGAIIQGSSQLFAEMLESLPADHPVPASCAAAFTAPAAAELSLCEAARGEAAMARSYSETQWVEQKRTMTPLQRTWGRVVYDPRKTEALLAPAQAWPCTSQAQEMVARDVPALRKVSPRSRQSFECVGNLTGCILADIAAPAYADYPQRMQDTGAMLRAVGTLLWLRERRAAGDSRAVDELLGEQPKALVSATRPLQLVEQGTKLEVARFDDRRVKSFKLPLPLAVLNAPPATVQATTR